MKSYENSASDAAADATGEHAPDGSSKDVQQDAQLMKQLGAMKEKDNGCAGDVSRAVAHLRKEMER
jgi:hypothetical protein